MGSHYLFSCPACQFTAEVSGGHDYGFASATATYCCRACGMLFDKQVSAAPWDHHPEKAPKTIACVNDPKHAAQLWEHPGPCPKCGTVLERSDEPTIMWD